MIYINMQYGNLPKETVDYAETRREASYLLAEYLLVGGAKYWLSSRPCANWRQSVHSARVEA